jgi:hypothetical protein
MQDVKRAAGTRYSAPILVASNVAPLLGVIYLDWNVFHVLFLMWCETLALGVVNLLRIASATGDESRALHFAKPFAMAIFAAHYGIFIVALGQMLLTLLGEPELGWRPGEFGPDFFGPPFYALAQLWPALNIAFIAMCASHLASYFINDLWHKEYQRTKIIDTMKKPYQRLIPVHIAMCFGAIAVEGSGAPLGLLVLLAALKTVADLLAHLREHKAAGVHVAR